MMNSFTFVSYNGPDAGQVLVKFLKESSENDDHDLETKTKIAVGFQPNPVQETEGEEHDEPNPD